MTRTKFISNLILFLSVIIIIFIIKQKLQYNNDNYQNEFENKIKKMKSLKWNKIIRQQMLEHPFNCYKIHIFVLKPIYNEIVVSIEEENTKNKNDKNINNKYDNDNNNKINDDCTCRDNKKINSNTRQELLSNKKQQQQQHERENIKCINDKTTSRDDKIVVDTTSNPIIYMFVIFLIVSLIKATIDFSKQIKKVNTPGNDDFSRRCSLQEYASRHHRKNSKKTIRRCNSSTTTPTTITQPKNSIYSITTTIKPKLSQIGRHISLNNSIVSESEPGSPAKSRKLNGFVLTRRSSFPALPPQFLNNNVGKSRRPSMDSFSEGDSSSPDVKRRVRMIHRH